MPTKQTEQKIQIRNWDIVKIHWSAQTLANLFFGLSLAIIVLAYAGFSLQALKRTTFLYVLIYFSIFVPLFGIFPILVLKKAKKAIDKVAQWANSRSLDYAIETVFKKWLELDKLKPKEIVKKPYYNNNLMVWSETKKKWYVINEYDEWLEYAGPEQDIEWRIVK